MTVDKNHYLNEWKKRRNEEYDIKVQKLVEENILLRKQLNKALESLALKLVVIDKEATIKKAAK